MQDELDTAARNMDSASGGGSGGQNQLQGGIVHCLKTMKKGLSLTYRVVTSVQKTAEADPDAWVNDLPPVALTPDCITHPDIPMRGDKRANGNIWLRAD